MASQLINVIVNSKGAVTVTRELNAMGDAARTTTTYLNSLRAILAAALTFSGVGAIVQVADTFTVLQNRLRQVAQEGEAVGDSWQRLMQIANSSYSTIDGTVNLYFRVAQAYKAWGESAEEAYEFTELFQKAAILSGSSMQTTAQAVYQFGQALNKGKLDGDEFRSVLEGLPYVATLIQKELGVTRAELYELSASGKISVDRLTQAFTNAAEVIQNDWKNITPTIAMAMTVLSNNWTDFVGKVQTSTGIFTVAAYAILAIANNFEILAIALAPVAAAFVWLAGRLGIGLVVMAFRDLGEVLKLATAAQWLFNAAVSANPYVIAAVAITALVSLIIYFRNEIGLTNERLSGLWAAITNTFTYLMGLLTSVFTYVGQISAAFYEWVTSFTAINAAVSALVKLVINSFKSMIKSVVDTAQAIADSMVPVWEQITELASNLYGLIKDLVDLIVDSWLQVFKDLTPAWNTLYSAMKPGLDFIFDMVGKIYEGLKFLGEYLNGPFFKVIRVVFEGWMFILEKIFNFINKMIAALRTAIALLRQLQGAGSGGGGGGGGAHYGAQFKAGEGFATGGQFKVGGTGAGRDTTPVAFRAERGERVTVETKKQQRQADNAGGSTSVNVPVQVVNVLDPAMMVAAMSSAAGERVVTNIIKANRDEVTRILGAA